MMESSEKITEGLLRIKGKRSNIYLLTDEPLTLIDTGMPGDGGSILSALREAGIDQRALRYILLTHGHLDHVGSLAAVKAATGARAVAGVYDRDHIEGRKMLCSMRREGAGGNLFRVMLFIIEKFVQKYVPAAVDTAAGEGAGRDAVPGIDIIETPGHSNGSLSFYHKAKGLLFAGDALSGAPLLRLPVRAGCSDYGQAISSVRKIAALDFNICLFGHGEPAVGGAGEKVRSLL